MNSAQSLLLALAIGSCSQPSPGADLTKLDRTLAKEPTYQSRSPRYCMLVFGPEVKTRAWLVLDGDTLYLDRNGNGDLTEDGERLKESHVNKELASPLISDGHHFVDLVDPSRKPFTDADRDVPTLSGTTRYTRFALHYFVLNKKYLSQRPEEIETSKNFARYLEGYVEVYVKVHRWILQRGRARFTSKPSDAPVIHFDGPMAFEFHDPDRTKPKLVRGSSIDLKVRVATRGLGKGTVTYLGYETIPEILHPVAEIEYPSRTQGKTISTLSVLDQRGGYDGFHGIIDIPKEAAIGAAKLRLAFPNLPQVDITPTTLEAPVVDSAPAHG